MYVAEIAVAITPSSLLKVPTRQKVVEHGAWVDFDSDYTCGLVDVKALDINEDHTELTVHYKGDHEPNRFPLLRERPLEVGGQVVPVKDLRGVRIAWDE